MSNRQAGAALTRGLVQALVLVTCVGVVLALVLIAAVGALDRQIAYWARIEAIDTLREQLSVEGQTRFRIDQSAVSGQVIGTLDKLSEAIATLGQLDPDDVFSTKAGEMVSNARGLFVAELDARARLSQKTGRIALQIDRLQDISRAMASAQRSREQTSREAAEAVDNKQRRLYGVQTGLTEAMLAAQRVQRQIVGANRLARTSSEAIAVATSSDFSEAGLPSVCAPGTVETATRICSPSIARVRRSLDALSKASPDAMDEARRSALWALEAYVRAGELRYREITDTLKATIDQARLARAELSQMANSVGALGRINHLLLQLETRLDDAKTGSASSGPTPSLEVLLPQVRIRMMGLVTLSSLSDAEAAEIPGIVDAIGGEWTKMASTLQEETRLHQAFETQLAALSQAIASRAERVRKSTTLWVNVFASVSLAVAAALVAFLIGTSEVLRRRFLHPLRHVTDTILSLAQGRLETPVSLNQQAFGFDRLGEALEQLRQAMAERSALADRNAEQKQVIERNLCDLERSSREMEWLAMHDPLTGLRNRRHADRDLAELTAKSQVSREDFCLIHLDVDRFKEINDALGHDAGDFVLKSIASQINGFAGPDVQCYRIGGDEFLMVFEGAADEDDVRQIAEALIGMAEQPLDYGGHACRVGASLGIAFGRDAGFDAAATLINADLALYDAKRDGRKAFRYYSVEQQDLSRYRKDMSDLILEAIDTEAFVPFYQPQFFSEGLRLRGVETVCRWQHPSRGWISPGTFLPIAEDLKVVGKIDQILFRKVSRDLTHLQASGLTIPKVSFNLTADRLLKANLAEELSEVLVGDVRIAVELLESMSLDSLSDSVRWAIDSLKERGIEIEIDDFGSCRASVAGLIAVGPDAMKIDRSIILPLTESPQHLQLVKAIIQIGRALDIEVVAEGVETMAHTEVLQGLGCDVLQGFALARPMPIAQLMDLLRADPTGKPAQDAALAIQDL